jgi:hypothetical protein
VLEEEYTFEEDSFEEDTFEEDTFEEDTLGEGTSEHDVPFEAVVLEEDDTFEGDDTFEEDASEHVPFTMRAREGMHNVALYSVPIKALR